VTRNRYSWKADPSLTRTSPALELSVNRPRPQMSIAATGFPIFQARVAMSRTCILGVTGREPYSGAQQSIVPKVLPRSDRER
jgi:hypothetical protein